MKWRIKSIEANAVHHKMFHSRIQRTATHKYSNEYIQHHGLQLMNEKENNSMVD